MVSFVLLLSAFFAYRASQLQFDYEFENFFPQHDNKLDFFNKYRAEFENDNDFILFALVNKEGIFKEDFLEEVSAFSQELEELPYVRQVISPTEAKKLVRNVGRIGFSQVPYIHVQESNKYAEDSLNLYHSQDWPAKLISWEANSIAIVLKNEENLSKIKSDELSEGIKDLVEKYNFDELHYIGKITGQEVYIDVLKSEFGFFMGLSTFLLLVILILVYRSWWGIIIPLTTVLFAVVASLGIMNLAGKSMNMMNVLLPIIMLVVGMSDVVHFTSKYMEELKKGFSKIDSIKKTIKNVGFATFFTSLTTAIGFVSLITVSVPPVAEFGIFTALGVIAAFIITILFVPAILMLSKEPKIKKSNKDLWNEKVGGFFILLIRKRKWVYLMYALILLLSLWGISKIQYDYYIMKDLSEDHQLMKDLRFFQDHHGGIRPFELAIIVKPKDSTATDFAVMNEILKVEKYLKKTYKVNHLVSVTTPFLYANRSMHQNSEAYFKFPEKRKRYNYLLEQIKEADREGQLSMLLSSDEKIARISGKMIDPGSREILKRNESFSKFFQENINTELIGYELTGSTVIIDQSSRYISRNILLGLLLAFLVIAVVMGILFRSFYMAFISLIPNILPLLIIAGLIGFLKIDLNMITSIIFTIGFGIAVDDSIHFMSRYKIELKAKKSNIFALRRTYLSTGKAIILTSLILLSGFFSLSFSDFLSTAYIGLFVSLILIFALICDMTLLPLLLLKKLGLKK